MLFRLLLAIPHLVWLVLWSIAVFFAVIAAWFAALATGRVPDGAPPLPRGVRPLRRARRAYVYVVGRRFPGFTGRAGVVRHRPRDRPPRAQSRWKTLFRFFLAIPALLLASALGGVLFVVAFLGWWYALVRARMPEGLRNLGAACLRYSEQTYAYLSSSPTATRTPHRFCERRRLR